MIVVCRKKIFLGGTLPDARYGFGDPSDPREDTDNAARKGCTLCSWGSVSTNGSLADIPVEPKRGATNPRLARKAQLRGGTFDSNDWSGRSHDGAKHGRMGQEIIDIHLKSSEERQKRGRKKQQTRGISDGGQRGPHALRIGVTLKKNWRAKSRFLFRYLDTDRYRSGYSDT